MAFETERVPPILVFYRVDFSLVEHHRRYELGLVGWRNVLVHGLPVVEEGWVGVLQRHVHAVHLLALLLRPNETHLEWVLLVQCALQPVAVKRELSAELVKEWHARGESGPAFAPELDNFDCVVTGVGAQHIDVVDAEVAGGVDQHPRLLGLIVESEGRIGAAVGVDCDFEAALGAEEEEVETVSCEVLVAVCLVGCCALPVECVVEQGDSLLRISDHDVTVDRQRVIVEESYDIVGGSIGHHQEWGLLRSIPERFGARQVVHWVATVRNLINEYLQLGEGALDLERLAGAAVIQQVYLVIGGHCNSLRYSLHHELHAVRVGQQYDIV